jgi:hypothetical protein
VLFVCFWVVAGVEQLSNPPGRDDVFLQVIWPFGFVAVIWGLARILLGKEVVTASDRELAVQPAATWPLRATKHFARDRIEHLRVDVAPRNLWQAQLERQGYAGGSIAFDYGARTHRFGSRLDEAESRQLVELLAKELRLEPPAAEPERAPPFT